MNIIKRINDQILKHTIMYLYLCLKTDFTNKHITITTPYLYQNGTHSLFEKLE